MPECAVHKLIADVCLVAKDKVLLVRYQDTAGYDGQTGWFLPDDLLRHFEPPEEAAMRLVFEQAGIEVSNPFLSHVESFKGKDGSWHLAFHFVVQLPEVPGLTPGDTVMQYDWFDLTKLPPKAEVAHGGWALNTLREILERAAG